MSDAKPLKLAILWHMHQPDYLEPFTNRLVMPWVRLHAVKDYLDMPLRAARFEKIKTTFNLVPSLIDQMEIYLNGGTDPHLELSRVNAESLTDGQKRLILETFFSGNPTQMIEPYPRYRELHKKARTSFGQEILPALFSSSEMRDLQVWSNLTWVDPFFRMEEPIKYLLAKSKNYSEEDKQRLLDWQISLMKRIVPTYVDLYNLGRIDVSFTPYYHPILPLLCDTDVATEAIPGIQLPQRRFRHPEDAEKQVELAMGKFEAIFGRKMTGMWPSEGSVSEEVADLCMRKGIKWIATDEDILFNSLRKSGLDRNGNPLHTIYEYGPGLKLFFRDRALSDRIGFVYSGWNADKAVADFMSHLRHLRELLADKIDEVVVPVILDGENAWEYFPGDGEDFLNGFYQAVSDDPNIETITMSEAIATIKARPLPSLFAGSWINHNFRIWIGHPEDNAAWDFLGQTRDRLVEFEKQNPGYNPERLRQAWTQIYKAEGSDWCWWYGDEHRGHNNEEFDRIFRRHLIAVYELLGLEVPFRLLNAIYQSGPGLKAIPPDALLTPEIDGRLTHFYEWAGAGSFDCLKAGGSMHRADRCVSKIFFAYDHERVYIRLDFVDAKVVKSLKKPALSVVLFTPERMEIRVGPTPDGAKREEAGKFAFCWQSIVELAAERRYLWPQGFGTLGMTVTFLDGDAKLESWPDGEPIRFEVAEKGLEMFWPS